MPLKYIGNGEALLGFPAKDLSDDEILQYAKKFLVQNGLYIETFEPPTIVELKNTGKTPSKSQQETR